MSVTLTVVGKYDGKDLAKAEKSLQALKKEAQAASSPFTRFGDAFEKSGQKIADVGSKMSKKLTLPILGFAAAAGYAYNQVDDGLDTVAARSGITGDALKGLQDSFKVVAKSATQDMTTVGEVVGNLAGRLNLTGKPLETLSSKMLDLARIAGVDAKSATDAVAKAMTGLGIGAQGSGKFLDMLLVASQKSGIGVDKLAATLAATGPAFRTMGFSTEQATGMIAAFERAGLPSTRMVAGLNAAAGKLAKQGVKDIPGAMAKAIEGIKNAGSESEATAKAVKLFGTRAGVALADSVRRGTLSVDDLNAALKNSGGALDEAKKATDGPAESMARLKNQAMLVGASFADAVVPVFEKLIPKVQALFDKFSNLSPGMKTAIVVAGGVLAALGPVLSVVGNLTKAVGMMSNAIAFGGQVQKAFAGEAVASAAAQKIAAAATKVWSGIQAAFNLVMSANPIILVGLAIAALVAGVIIAYKKFDWFRDLVNTVGHALKVGFVGAWNAVKTAVKTVVDFLVDLWDGLKSAGKFLVDAYIAYFRLWRDALSTLAGWVVEGVGKILGFFRDIPKKLSELPGKMVDIGKAIVEGVWKGISGAAGWLWDKVKGWGSDFISGVKGIFGIHSPSRVMSDIGDQLMAGLGSGIITGSTKAIGSMDFVKKRLLESMKGVKDKKGIVAQIAKGISDALTKGALDALDKIQAKAKEVIDFAKGIADNLVGFGGLTGFDSSAYESAVSDLAAIDDQIVSQKEAVTKAMKALDKAQASSAEDKADQIIEANKNLADEQDALFKLEKQRIGASKNVEDTRGTAANIIADMKKRVEEVKKFGANLTALKGLGLNNSSLQEIISAGPTVGNAIAEALLKEGGSAIGQVNDLQAQLESSAGAIGDFGTQSQYGMSMGNADAIMNSQVNFAAGAVVVNVGAGADAATVALVQDAVTTAVNEAAGTAVQEALTEVAKQIKTAKPAAKSGGTSKPLPKPKPKPVGSNRGVYRS